MAQFDNPLAHVTVAAPCPAVWNQMQGNERVRFCGQCSLNVYNLSAMSRKEAEALIMRSEGRLCVRFYRRGDGTILTNNCPVGLRALQRRARKVTGAVCASVISFLTGIGVFAGAEKLNDWHGGSESRVMGALAIEAREPVEVNVVAGEMSFSDEPWVKGELVVQAEAIQNLPQRQVRKRRWRRSRF